MGGASIFTVTDGRTTAQRWAGRIGDGRVDWGRGRWTRASPSSYQVRLPTGSIGCRWCVVDLSIYLVGRRRPCAQLATTQGQGRPGSVC